MTSAFLSSVSRQKGRLEIVPIDAALGAEVRGIDLRQVDADHGYGNALNVMRIVNELEQAGVSILGIEDTVLPARFGHTGIMNELVSIEEMMKRQTV